MSDNVRALPGFSARSTSPNEAMIKGLEDLLAMARSGQLQSFVGVGWTCDGLRVTHWSDFHPDVYQMMGSLAWLQHEYVERHT